MQKEVKTSAEQEEEEEKKTFREGEAIEASRVVSRFKENFKNEERREKRIKLTNCLYTTRAACIHIKMFVRKRSFDDKQTRSSKSQSLLLACFFISFFR